ncbi:MAG: ABC transporter ATP-binding protein [Acidobacteria bacterium]|nr:MAG: ABC transporter ATP-binding protein [Acidobacteriota bacterium]
MVSVVIQIRGVTKVFNEGRASVLALRGVDLEIRSGELTLLIGPSGSGKTTLLSIMGCILAPTSGTIRVAGQDVSCLNQRESSRLRLEHFGFVFQDFNLFPTLTAGENVEVAHDLRGIDGSSAKRYATHLLEQVGLAERYRTYPADLSGGEKQRVAIARALAGNPKIILADEPTGSLDSNTGWRLMELMRDVAHERGRAAVIVTHDIRLRQLADRVITIQDGLAVPNVAVPAVPSSVSQLSNWSEHLAERKAGAS